MNGDFSRLTFDPRKHYSGVLMQQGRVQLDADWNEQQEIQNHRAGTVSADLIGRCGAPKEGGGFRVTPTDDGETLTISAGRYYVDGIPCNNEEDVTLTTQPDLPDLAVPTTPGVYLLYLDVWERHVTSLEDPDILESALGGPDTATRTKTVQQVRWLRVSDLGQTVNPDDYAPGWAPEPASGAGMLDARDQPESVADGRLLPPRAGYTRLENQLYRIEIHQGGALGTATFKWSRDNGSVATAITGVRDGVLTVADTGKDDVLGFEAGQWVEVIEDGTELGGQRGELVRISAVNREKREITLGTSLPAGLATRLADPDRHPRLRRWDQSGSGATGDGVATGAQEGEGWIPLESGVEVRFHETGVYKPGDYWLIPARTASGKVEWPPYDEPGSDSTFRLPRGIRRHYAALALVDFDSGVFGTVQDLRKLFPAATAITAEDVGFDNSQAGLPLVAGTVQDAIHTLARTNGNVCTFVVSPGDGWEEVFDRIADGESACVCLRIGRYELNEPIVFNDKGHLIISGCGPGTEIVAPDAESIFSFQGCESVMVRDLKISSGATGLGHLNGALNFVGCESVTVERVMARCAGAPVRAASCITTRGGSGPYEVRIRDCALTVGYQQVGMLLLDAERAQVEDNVLRADDVPEDLGAENLVRVSDEYRAKMRRVLISHAQPRARRILSDRSRDRPIANVRYGGAEVSFETDPWLVTLDSSRQFYLSEWQSLVEANPPSGVRASARGLLDHIRKLADRVLLQDPDLVFPADPFPRFPFPREPFPTDLFSRTRVPLSLSFRRAVNRFVLWRQVTFSQHPTLASQGIVMAGSQAVRDVRILNNTIRGVLQGIHLGPCPQSRTSVGGNTVEVFLPPPEIFSERHGIFAADTASLSVHENLVGVTRFESTQGTPIEGVRIHGRLGAMMLIRQNHLTGCTTGVLVRSSNSNDNQESLWLVAENVAPGADVPVDTGGSGVWERDNLPFQNS